MVVKVFNKRCFEKLFEAFVFVVSRTSASWLAD